MSIIGSDLIREMEIYAPTAYALENDPIGLQVGDPRIEVRGVLVCLDVTMEVVDEAYEKGLNWIIAHHPIIYRPLKNLRTDHPAGKIFAGLLRHETNVYVAHTNLDVTKNGVNDVLARKVGLANPSVFLPEFESKLKKLVVHVPVSHHLFVLEAITQAGAGVIGNYSACSFNVEGTGTFCPGEGTNPFIGEKNKLERVKEVRLETVFKEGDRERVIEAMLHAHPYEEVAYDIYPLEIEGEKIGLGRVGELADPVSLEEFALRVKSAYRVDGLRMLGDPQKKVKKVAIVGGSGGRFFLDAVAHGVDVYITGDVDYHTAQDAIAHGLAMIDPGHHVENIVTEHVCTILRERLEGIPVLSSTVNTDPFRFL